MKIHGKEIEMNQLRRSVGNMDQVAGVRMVQLDEANERPNRAALFHTGDGLEFTVLVDRCLDIAAASYRGQAMGWRSTTGDVAPQYYEAEGIRWLRSYFGGMLTTCGLTNVGAPGPDSALQGNGLHGRIGHTPARNIQVSQEWQDGRYVLSVTGTMRETSVFFENLTLKRTVSTALGESRFWITDVVTNEGFKDTPFMILYHCNFGWPALQAGSRMLTPSRHVAPRDAEAREGQEQWSLMDGPTHAYKEKCYYHDMVADAEGMVTAALVNPCFMEGCGFGAYVKYSQATLPRFIQWKQMGEQDYVVGFEPANCGVEGRGVDEAQELLHILKPGESRTHKLEFGAITTQEQVAALEKMAAAQPATLVESYKEFVKKPH